MNYIVLDLEWNQPFYMKKMIKKPVQTEDKAEIRERKLSFFVSIEDFLREKWYNKDMNKYLERVDFDAVFGTTK